MGGGPTGAQKTAVILAFVAAALSLTAAAFQYANGGGIAVTPIGGGLFMLALGIRGYSTIRGAQRR